MENSVNEFDNAFKALFGVDLNALEAQKNNMGKVTDIAPKRIVYKYNLDESTIVEEHIEQVLDVQIQNDNMVAWILINPLYPKKKIKFDIIGTGWPYGDRRSKYLTTIQEGVYVWHIFVRENPIIKKDS